MENDFVYLGIALLSCYLGLGIIQRLLIYGLLAVYLLNYLHLNQSSTVDKKT